MIRDTIQAIENKLSNTSLPDKSRTELLALLEQLKVEMEGLAQTDAECAESVAGFAEISTHEATRTKRNPESLDASLKGLSASVAEFEETHPQLVQVVNRICTTLANMGI